MFKEVLVLLIPFIVRGVRKLLKKNIARLPDAEKPVHKETGETAAQWLKRNREATDTTGTDTATDRLH